jgi:hypothetical protein
MLEGVMVFLPKITKFLNASRFLTVTVFGYCDKNMEMILYLMVSINFLYFS